MHVQHYCSDPLLPLLGIASLHSDIEAWAIDHSPMTDFRDNCVNFQFSSIQLNSLSHSHSFTQSIRIEICALH